MSPAEKEGAEKLEVKPKAGPDLIPWKKDRKFWYGFIGWFLINVPYNFVILPAAISFVRTFKAQLPSSITTPLIYVISFSPFIINIGLIIAFAVSKNYKRVAAGMLVAVAITLVLTIVAGILFLAYCFLAYGSN